MKNLHTKVMSTLKQYTYSTEKDTGFFVYDEADFKEPFESYSTKLTSFVEGTY